MSFWNPPVLHVNTIDIIGNAKIHFVMVCFYIYCMLGDPYVHPLDPAE